VAEFDEWKPEGVAWDEAPELWELQTGPHLTVGRLVGMLSRCDPKLPIRVTVYDGSDSRPVLDPVAVEYIGEGERPSAVVLTATNLGRP
jgi:hypothetical protein